MFSRASELNAARSIVSKHETKHTVSYEPLYDALILIPANKTIAKEIAQHFVTEHSDTPEYSIIYLRGN